MAEKGAAHNKRGAASRTTPTARVEIIGTYGGNVRQRNISPPILRSGSEDSAPPPVPGTRVFV